MGSEINLTPTASYLSINASQNGHGHAAGPITARTWGSPTECIAGALLVHGLGAHSGWFEALGRRLKVRRVFSLAYDQVGFGKRRQEAFTSQHQWYDDVVTGFNQLRNMIGDKPVFVMGNSMGAAVALKVVAERTVAPDGLILFSPGFEGHPSLFKLQYKALALISAFLHPEKEVLLPYDVDMITSDESVRAWLKGDPEMRFSPTGRMLLELLKLSLTLPKIRAVGCPVFMLRPGTDAIVDARVSQKIFDRLQSPSKQEAVFETAGHDLMFDPAIDDVSDQVVAWMTRIKKSATVT